MKAGTRTVTVDGLELRVRRRGAGPPVLLINGIGGHIGMWSVLEAALPDSTLITYDSPGTGGSQRSRLPMRISSLGRLAVRLLDQLGEDQVDLLGYSFGGIVAQHAALFAPERFRRVALVATTPGIGGQTGAPLAMLNLATPLRYYSRPFHERTVGFIAGGRARTDREWVRRDAVRRRDSRPSALGYMWQVSAVMNSTGTLARLPEIRQPTLVVSGGDDPIMPVANAMVLAARIPEARLLLAPDEGHLMLLDSRSRVLPEIRDFLLSSSLDSSAAWRNAVEVGHGMVEQSLPRGLSALIDPLRPVNALARRVCRPSIGG